MDICLEATRARQRAVFVGSLAQPNNKACWAPLQVFLLGLWIAIVCTPCFSVSVTYVLLGPNLYNLAMGRAFMNFAMGRVLGGLAMSQVLGPGHGSGPGIHALDPEKCLGPCL